MTTPAVRVWYAIVVAFIACVVVALASVFYASQIQRESDRRWCSLMTNLDDAYRATPPQTDTGRSVAAEVHKLRAELGCPPPLDAP